MKKKNEIKLNKEKKIKKIKEELKKRLIYYKKIR